MSINKKTITIGLLIAVLVVVLLVIFFGPRSISSDATRSTLPNTTMGRWDDGSIIFSNDRALVVYNLVDKKSRLISTENKLPPIKSFSVSKDKKYVLLHAPESLDSDLLGAQLKAQGATISKPYWWLFNVETGEFSHLSPGVISAQFGENNTVYAVSKLPDSPRILTYSLPSLKVTRDVKTAAEYVSISLAPDGVLYANTINDTVEKLDGMGSAEVILNDASGFSVSPNGLFATFTNVTKTDDNKVNLSVFDLNNKKSRTIGSLEEGLALWAPSGSTVIYSDGGKIYQRNFLNGGRQVTYKINGIEGDVEEIEPQLFINDRTSFIHTSEGDYFLSPQNFEMPKAPTNYKKTLNDQIAIEFLDKENAFFVRVEGTYTSENRALLYEQLRSDGYNPDLFLIRIIEYTLSGSRP